VVVAHELVVQEVEVLCGRGGENNVHVWGGRTSAGHKWVIHELQHVLEVPRGVLRACAVAAMWQE